MQIISTLSPQGARSIRMKESPGGRTVTRAYRCPANVITIGDGFTMGSAVFAEYWIRTRGRPLRMGDAITQEEADHLLPLMVDEEYGAAVARAIRPTRQHWYDGAASMTFNCGVGAVKWRWAQALARDDASEAARLLRVTAVTANGRRLPGLVARREIEAEIIEFGRYAHAPARAARVVDEETRWAQEQLATLGHDPGPVDGVMGPRTRAAVRAFQAAHDLVVDGIPGPATRAAIIRALDARLAAQSSAGGGAASGAGGGAIDSVSPVVDGSDAMLTALVVGLGVAALIWGGFWLWRNRGRFTGRRVPT